MKKLTFTKIIVAATMILYFIGAFFGIWIVKSNPECFTDLMAYIGAPTSVAIAFYAWKARAENTIKINRALTKQQLQLVNKINALDPEKQAQLEQVNITVDSVMAELEERSFL